MPKYDAQRGTWERAILIKIKIGMDTDTSFISVGGSGTFGTFLGVRWQDVLTVCVHSYFNSLVPFSSRMHQDIVPMIGGICYIASTTDKHGKLVRRSGERRGSCPNYYRTNRLDRLPHRYGIFVFVSHKSRRAREGGRC
jgi:hypothetical protein